MDHAPRLAGRRHGPHAARTFDEGSGWGYNNAVSQSLEMTMHALPWKALAAWLACLFVVASCAGGDPPDSVGGSHSGFDSADAGDAGGGDGGSSERRAVRLFSGR